MSFQAVIKKKYGQDAVNVGDEGGFAPNIQVGDDFKIIFFYTLVFGYLVTIWPVADVLFRMQENKEGLELLKSAIDKAGYTGKVSFPPCRNFVLVLWLFKCLLLREFDILYTVLLRLSLEWMLQLPSSTRRTNHMI
jgi:hypothetical protein